MTASSPSRLPEPSAARPVRNGLILLAVGVALWLYRTALEPSPDGGGAPALVATLAVIVALIGITCFTVGLQRAVRKVDELHARYVEARPEPGVATRPPAAS